MATQWESLLHLARGGRVLLIPFTEPQAQMELEQAAREEGLALDWFGGFPFALRRAGYLRPPELPPLEDPTRILALDSDLPTDHLLEASLRGDLHRVGGELWLATLAQGEEALLRAGISFRRVNPSELPRGRRKTIVVPSPRLDVVGARSFGISRNLFAQGMRLGKVQLDGHVAEGKDPVRQGSSVLAEGLGGFRVLQLLGSTRRGNLRLEVEVYPIANSNHLQ
jgi:RNA-binding protein YlmH